MMGPVGDRTHDNPIKSLLRPVPPMLAFAVSARTTYNKTVPCDAIV